MISVLNFAFRSWHWLLPYFATYPLPKLLGSVLIFFVGVATFDSSLPNFALWVACSMIFAACVAELKKRANALEDRSSIENIKTAALRDWKINTNRPPE